MKALSTLVLSGTRVRDALDTPSKEPSRVLERTVIDYIRWSEDDADLEDRDIIPALYIRRQRKSDDIQDTVDDLTYDLKEAATRIRLHKNSMNKIKVIYGVVIAKTVTAFVSYEVAKSDGEVRNLAVFNWMDEGQDVWNALAIAILVITVRDMLYSLDAERIGYSPEQDSDK